MKISLPLLILPVAAALLLVAAQPASRPSRLIDRFETHITGDFSNQKQVDAELRAGRQIHPLAKHINRRADAKIRHAPPIDGFWLLEESYYQYPGKPLDAKPYLFRFEAAGDTAVKLTVYKFPAGLPVDSLKNDNQRLVMDYKDLVASPTFKPTFYRLTGHSFSTHAVNDLGNGMRFTLTETFTRKKLVVMELLEKNGSRITPYDTPIVYDRVESFSK